MTPGEQRELEKQISSYSIEKKRAFRSDQLGKKATAEDSVYRRSEQMCSKEFRAGLPDENFNKKPNSAKKRPENGQTDCLKARKKPNYLRNYHAFVTKKYLNYKNYKKNYFKLR